MKQLSSDEYRKHMHLKAEDGHSAEEDGHFASAMAWTANGI